MRYLFFSLLFLLLFSHCKKNTTTSSCSESIKKKYKFYFDDTCGGVRWEMPHFFSEERPVYMGIFFENGDTLAYTKKEDLTWIPVRNQDSTYAILEVNIEYDSELYKKLQKAENAHRRARLVFVAGLAKGKVIKQVRFCFLACPMSVFSYSLTAVWLHASNYREDFFLGHELFVKRYERYMRGEITTDELYFMNPPK